MAAPDWAGFAGFLAGSLALGEMARDRAQAAFLDTLACIAAGADTPAARAVRGQPAVLRWVVAGHALDYDDYDRPSIGHPSVVLVPVALALGRDGASTLAAYVAGVEAMDRLGDVITAAHYDRGWHATATLGTIGAAVTAGRCLGLNAAQMLDAMTLAAGAAAGLKAQFGSTGKPIGAGLAALNGVICAQIAAQGGQGRAEALTAFVTLTGSDTPGPLRFGRQLAIEEFGLIAKPYPCCGYLGRLVPQAVALFASVDVAQIAHIRLTLPPRNALVLGYGLPRTEDEARFSAPYCVAAALIQGRLDLSDFTPDAIARPEIRQLAAKIEVVAAAHQNSPEDLSPADPDEIEIGFADGTAPLHRVCTDLPGSPDTPMTDAMLAAKIDACGARALADLAADLASQADIAPLRDLLEDIV